MNYTKEDLEFLKEHGFRENYPYGMLYDLDVTVKGDHADNRAGVYYIRNESGAMWVYYSSFLEMMIEYMSYADMPHDEFEAMKAELLEDIQIWIGKLNKVAGTSFKATYIDIPMRFFMKANIQEVDFQALCKKIRKFVVLMDRSLNEIFEKICETSNWDVKFGDACIGDITDIDDD